MLTPAQYRFVAGLLPERRRRLDRLRQRDLEWLLGLVDTPPDDWFGDTIIEAEVERILGPVTEAESSP
jgi:hypothetical protein